MSNLQARLAAALGAQYRIERELGGGGMSHVFLAEETALGRRVVLKVLPPGLAAALSPDRFQREVRLAAALQHPHVVPLLAAGAAGDLLYYTMPFVEGESLRARLSREGELPVSEAVRLLREVTDALAYAHRQGIVHRDIKPDNILLSHGHAVVTDFGIAKALSEAGGGATLTATGMAIGTPAYMSPEQATGEANVDQRSDIYSIGALAYEMLAGEPPFRGATLQALIAAQLTRAPALLAEARPAVPAELAAIIHRCLEKRPADRFQHAEELLAALEPFATSTPTSVRTIAAPAAGRAWPLPHVLGYFAVAGAALLGGAWALRTLAGLPDWFFPAAVVLLALGLPVVVLATVTHNRRRAGATTPALPFPGAAGRNLTLRRAVLGGVTAFVTLGLVTTAYMAMRALGIGPVGTLVASGKLNERERLIIADFENKSRDPLLGPAITQAFRVDFAQSKMVSPVEADYVRRILRRMRRPDSIPVSRAVAREIAQREGFKAIVSGEIQQVGANYLVSAEVVSADSDQVLATARETARDSTGILDAVDKVSKRLRERIGESLKSIRDNKPLADVTTGSLEALRQYSEAIRSQTAGDNPRAIALLEAAVATDSSFGMAWRKLGVMLANAGERPTRAEEALTRAFRLRDNLTLRERKLTENSYYSDVKGEMDSATAALQSLLLEYPSDSWAHNNLGVAYEVAGNKAAAEKSYQHAVDLEPENVLAWGNLLGVEIGLARFDSAAVILNSMKSRFPASRIMDLRDVNLLLGARDFAAAEKKLREVMARYSSNQNTRAEDLRILGAVLAVRGKFVEAQRSADEAAQIDAAAGRSASVLADRIASVFANGMYGTDRRAAAARLEAALRETPLDKLAPRERPMIGLIQAAVGAGATEHAKSFLAEFDRNPGNIPGRVAVQLRSFARALVLGMETATLPQALTEYRRTRTLGACTYCTNAAMAGAYDRAGMPDSTLVYYRLWADAGEEFWDSGIPNYWQPLAYFRLGELYQAKGDKERAREFYGKFTELWRDADPELQPKVKEARQRIRELIQEPR